MPERIKVTVYTNAVVCGNTELEDGVTVGANSFISYNVDMDKQLQECISVKFHFYMKRIFSGVKDSIERENKLCTYKKFWKN